MSDRTAAHRAGFSLAELIIALSLFSILLATTLGFYRQQGDAFSRGNEQMTIMQNLRYGVNALEQNLRAAGVGVPTKQPVVVYASDRALAFNGDYATRTANDFFAVYYDPRLPASQAAAVTPARKFVLPTSSFAYPDSAYYQGSGNSPAETITFFFALDTATERTDDWVLFRQVNDAEPEVIARNLLATEAPFFTYYATKPEGTAGNPIREVPSTHLPMRHAVPIHGAPGDTGAVARVDSVRAVRISYAATNGLTGPRESTRRIDRLIRLPNAGLETPRSCGNKPFLGVPLVATAVAATETESGYIVLSWDAAIDEVTGEQDVLRYVIWRKTSASAAWGDPLVSVSPGAETYVHQDRDLVPGTQYWYALAAQDCTPQYSELSTAGPITAPAAAP